MSHWGRGFVLGESDFTLRVQGRIKGTFYTHHHQSVIQTDLHNTPSDRKGSSHTLATLNL